VVPEREGRTIQIGAFEGKVYAFFASELRGAENGPGGKGSGGCGK
jgi:hypothetical protein